MPRAPDGIRTRISHFRKVPRNHFVTGALHDQPVPRVLSLKDDIYLRHLPGFHRGTTPSACLMLHTACTLLFKLGLVVKTAYASYTGVVQVPGSSSPVEHVLQQRRPS